MSVRSELARKLREALPQYQLIAGADTPAKVARPTLLLWQGNIARLEQIGHDRVRVELVLWLLVGNDKPEAAEDALEAALDDVIEALRPLTWVYWPTAERLTFGEPDGPSYHGYRFNLTGYAEIGE